MSSLKRLGKYEIIEPIGHGGMAAVYKGYQPDIDRYVAVKVLPPHPGQNEQYATRFRLEARTIARLQHPHILPVFDYGVEDDVYYLVMAFVDGGSVSDLIDRGPMSLNNVERLLRQVASALDYAHRSGVIHRDIKPDNILMDKEGHALLADFGIVKLLEGETNLTATGGMVGTPAYMAPEQCQGVEVDGRADIYALGVVAYEMITGKQPFTADTPMQVVLKHVTEPVPHINQVMDGLPEKLESVMMRVLAKDPDARYSTTGEFVQDFTRAIYGDDAVGELARKLGTGSFTTQTRTPTEILPGREPILKKIGKSPLALLGLFLAFVAFLMTGLNSVNRSQQNAASNISSTAVANGEGSLGRLSFSSTSFLGDTVNLRVENLIPPGANQTYTVWLENGDDTLRLGDLALDALGSGALVFTDAEGRMLPAAFNSARITLESRSATTGYRLSSPNVRVQTPANDTPTGATVYRAEVTPAVSRALAEILAASAQGIDGSSLLDSTVIEVSAALENSQLDYRGTLGGIYTNAEYTLNILRGEQEDYNGNGSGENPGRGAGVLVFLDQMDAQIDALADSSADTVSLQSVRACVENTRVRVNRIVDIQRDLLEAESLADALPLADESDELVAAIIPGADQNANGRIEPFAGECGLEQIASFGMLISSMELEANTEAESA